MFKRIRRWWTAERAVEELVQLDDRLLADIGLDRAELRQRILSEAAKAHPVRETEADLCLHEVLRS